MAQRTDEQGYYYWQLREQIESYLAVPDYPAIAALITPENVDLVSRCAPGMAAADYLIDSGSLEGMYSQYENFVTELERLETVDEVLTWFNSSTAALSSFSLTFLDSADAEGAIPYFETLNTEKTEPLC